MDKKEAKIAIKMSCATKNIVSGERYMTSVIFTKWYSNSESCANYRCLEGKVGENQLEL